MDIKDQENTYEGFLSAVKYGAIGCIVTLLLLLAVYIA